MKVLVTGGTGDVGPFVVDELVRRGHEVTVAGRRPNMTVPNANYMALDVTDYPAVREAVGVHDSVIHLAGVPRPQGIPVETFDINCRGTYHIYQACAESGIKKLAVASSVNALGLFYGVKPLPIRYFPVDEEHPTLCSDEYSFSKKVIEEIGEYFWHAAGISSVAIRIPWVAPCKEGEDRLRTRQSPPSEPFLIRNLWIWIDSRDSARAFVDGIEKPYEGAHTLFCNDSVNNIGVYSRELAARFYPEVTDWREPVEGLQALVSCRKAKEVLGWEPIYNTVHEEIRHLPAE